jgi:tetratricopeptide (TPR) repeat protein
MDCIRFNCLPFSVIVPTYKAYEVDTLPVAAIPALAMPLLSPEEKKLKRAAQLMSEYDFEGAAVLATKLLRESPGYSEAHVVMALAAAKEDALENAAQHLEAARSHESTSGEIIRKFLPSLRILTRISRFHFFPVYPDYYGVSLMLAAAYWRLGRTDEALRVLRELVGTVGGWRDEMRVLAAEAFIGEERWADAEKITTKDEASSRDDLDMTMNLLRALALYKQGKYHEAARSLRQDLSYAHWKSKYVTAIAQFVYIHALEKDGLPVLALRQSVAMDLKLVLNPDVRTYVRWQELRLRTVVERLEGEELFTAAEFKWISGGKPPAGSKLAEVVPADGSTQQESALQRLDEMSGPSRLRLLHEMFRRAKEDGVDMELKPEGDSPVEFDPNQTYDWSISQTGERETFAVDFRGEREAPKIQTVGEQRLRMIDNAIAIGGGVLILLLLLKACLG